MPLSDPLRYTCPACGSHAGERCRDADGDITETFHGPRVQRAGREAEGRGQENHNERKDTP